MTFYCGCSYLSTAVYVQGDTAITALDHVNLSVDAGVCVAVMGPSGCGKSAPLHLLGGLDRPERRNEALVADKMKAISQSNLAGPCPRANVIVSARLTVPEY